MTFLLILIVATGTLALTMFLLLRHEDNRRGGGRRGWGRSSWNLVVGVMITAGVLCVVGIIAAAFMAKYLAGQGDGPAFARQWVERWHPAAHPEVECQELDSDDNGYITCTVGYDDEQGKHQLEAIECGVNRWYHGFRTTGCRLMRGYSGSQP